MQRAQSTVDKAMADPALQAGAGVKGEFENRLKGLINEVKNSPTPMPLPAPVTTRGLISTSDASVPRNAV